MLGRADAEAHVECWVWQRQRQNFGQRQSQRQSVWPVSQIPETGPHEVTWQWGQWSSKTSPVGQSFGWIVREDILKKSCFLSDIFQKGGGGPNQIQKFCGSFF